MGALVHSKGNRLNEKVKNESNELDTLGMCHAKGSWIEQSVRRTQTKVEDLGLKTESGMKSANLRRARLDELVHLPNECTPIRKVNSAKWKVVSHHGERVHSFGARV